HRRPQDDVAMDLDAATEDEFALCAMTGLSPYLEWAFPRGGHVYRKYLTFRGVPEDEVARWRAALTLFLKKLTLKYGRPLVLKSPPHTARIRLLLEVFPDARFVHIHRNPYDVFRSTKHLHNAIGPYLRFQAGGCFDSDDDLIATYAEMYDAFFEERDRIPEGRSCEVEFEELEREPIRRVRSVYEALGLSGFEPVRPPLDGYLASIAGYRKNHHDDLPESLRDRIAERWRRSSEACGYGR